MFNNEIDAPRFLRTKYGEGYEARKIKNLLGDFNFKTSPAYHLITSRWGDLKLPELQNIVDFVCSQLTDFYPIRIDSRSKRNKPTIYKWFQDNFDIVAPIINNMTLSDSLEDIIYQMENN